MNVSHTFPMHLITLATILCAGAAAVRPPLPVRDLSRLLPPQGHPARARHFRALGLWHASSVSSSTYSSSVAQSTGGVINPIAFGADPSGRNDSTAAMQAAVSALLALSVPHNTMADEIKGLGGAVLDLSGGEYLISQPIVIPNNYGNLLIAHGSLLASSTFPPSQYLVQVGGTGACDNSDGSCNQFVNFDSVFFDANNNTAAGGLALTENLFGSVRGCFFTGFSVAGLLVTGGHDLVISESWFGEWYSSDPRKANFTESPGSGIVLNGNDHVIDNVIVFSGRVGIVLNGAANQVRAAHTWNLSTSRGGIGILVPSGYPSQNRILDCYLDYADIVLQDPKSITVTGGFFLGGGQVVLQAVNSSMVGGVVITENQFYGTTNDNVALNETLRSFTSVIDTVIENNLMPSSQGASGGTMRYIKPTTSTFFNNATSATIDFSPLLLFQNCTALPLRNVLYSVRSYNASAAPVASFASVDGCQVTVTFNSPVSGGITVQVDQSTRSV
jgi:hypothetical protein